MQALENGLMEDLRRIVEQSRQSVAANVNIRAELRGGGFTLWRLS